jgi:hypothetical protein
MKERPAFLRHEEVYHAAHQVKPLCCAPLSLTWLRLRGLKKACLMERQKNGGFAFLLKACA